MTISVKYDAICRAIDGRKTITISFLTAAILTFVLIGSLINSSFSILDDHHIMEWLGSDNQLHSNDYVGVLLSTEIGGIGHTDRFRPFSYLQMVTETWAFGSNPRGYHAVQIVSFFLLLWSIAWASFRTVGYVVGLAVLFAVVNGQFWGDLWTYSFFTSEQSAVFGLALVVFAYGVVFRDFIRREDYSASFILLAIGTLICAGSKENFIFLVGPYVLVALFGIWQKRLSAVSIAAGAIALAAMLIVVYGVIYPNMGKAYDVYGYDNSVGHRLRAMAATGIVYAAIFGMFVAGPLGVWGLKLVRKHHPAAAEIFSCSAIIAVCSLYLLWEMFFYNGRIPSGNHYDFPSALLYPAAVSAMYYAFLVARRHRLIKGTTTIDALSRLLCALVLVIIGLAISPSHRLLDIIERVHSSNHLTKLMASDLQSVRNITDEHPNWPIIIVPSNPWDFEPALTAPIWFKKFGVLNPLVMSVDIKDSDLKTPFERWLVDTLKTVSANGSPKWKFDVELGAVQQDIADSHCFEVVFRGTGTKCEQLPYSPDSYLPWRPMPNQTPKWLGISNRLLQLGSHYFRRGLARVSQTIERIRAANQQK